jgi:superfamily II DNA or RNA helicase
LKLEDLKSGSNIVIEPSGERYELITVDWVGNDAVTAVLRAQDQQLEERVFYRTDESRLSFPEKVFSWSFDANGELFRMAAEARRIQLAHHFDPLFAVNTSQIEPLPHQITAVYQDMLPRQPLRFLLADDPGAGKTIMAGLLIKELMVRGDVGKCMVVCPGSLVEQWQDELWQKFQLRFEIMTNDKLESSVTGNWFEENPLAICRLDKLSRDETLHPQMRDMDWDLVVVDEAHKMSASAYGAEINRTQRYRLGEILSAQARHFLLMTATPHNGKDQNFQLFLKLIDEDRFEGAHRRGVKTANVSDMMRRQVKEELLKFDGTRLFPERMAYTANYELTDLEHELYEDVTSYVRTEFNRADRITGKRKGTIGFALTVLQRRLASSPAAIHASLGRRADRLETRLEELRSGGSTAWAQGAMGSMPGISWDDEDDLPGEEFEEEEQRLLDEATAATTETELVAEISSLRTLERTAARVKRSGKDRKWDELSRILDHEEMKQPSGARRKLVIFTEHVDTLKYLYKRITDSIGGTESVVIIRGGMNRNDRRNSEESFRNDPEVHFLLATDAAGEGINLQRAHLMVNYDLPWNPNRLEQRFGRIHRIGQQEVCHLWNLVAANTREGEVFKKLFEKLQAMKTALGGAVYDVLGRVFREERLEDLLKEAIRYSSSPEVKAKLFEKVDNLLDQKNVQGLIEQHALVKNTMDLSQVQKVRDEMDRAAANRLQPHHISPFFQSAFKKLGGSFRSREQDRFELTNVPQPIRRWAAAKNPRNPVANRYQRISFKKEQIHIDGKPEAEFLSPGHPLLDTVVEMALDRWQPLLKRGATLVDPLDSGADPRLLVMLEHTITDGRKSSTGTRMIASRRFQFVEINESGKVIDAGPAPFLEYDVLEPDDAAKIDEIKQSQWLAQSLKTTAVEHAIQHIVPRHLSEVTESREDTVKRTMAAVQERLSHEIQFQNSRFVQLKSQQEAGTQPKINPEQARRRIEELEARRDKRLEELKRELDLTPQPPVIVGAALVVPASLVGITTVAGGEGMRNDPATELAAMEAVMDYERSLGNEVTDVSDQKIGYDVLSKPKDGRLRLIEVKGRKVGSENFAVTRNEILTALNSPDQYHLVLVFVEENYSAQAPIYIENVFNFEPEIFESHKILKIKDVLAAAGITL